MLQFRHCIACAKLIEMSKTKYRLVNLVMQNALSSKRQIYSASTLLEKSQGNIEAKKL